MQHVWNIDGFSPNVVIEGVELSANMLDGEAAGRMNGTGDMITDRIGMFYGHKLTISLQDYDAAEFKQIWDIITDPTKNHTITAPGIIGNMTYEAYVGTTITTKMRRHDPDGFHIWDNIVVSMIPIQAQRRA